MKKVFAVLLGALVMVQLSSAGAAESKLAPEAKEQMLTNMAVQNPEGYEAFRREMVDRAATYEEFLEWATPEEIAQDLGIDPNDNQNLIQNSGTAKVRVNVSLGGRSVSVSSPQGSFGGGALGGRPGYATVKGCFTPTVLSKHHRSSRYNNAPMPNSVFFFKGQALHAGSLSVMSHGCVHLDFGTSAKIYNLVEKYGRGNTVVCVR